MSNISFEKHGLIFNKNKVTLLSRIRTFEEWEYNLIQNSKVLANCGFYAMNDRDLVRCFYCGIVIGSWASEDIPWMEHFRHSKNCTFINLNKIRLKEEAGLENSLIAEMNDGKLYFLNILYTDLIFL